MSGRGGGGRKGKDPVVPAALFAGFGKLSSGRAPGARAGGVGFASHDGITPPQPTPAAAAASEPQANATPPPGHSQTPARAAPPPVSAAPTSSALPPGEQWATSADPRAESVNAWSATMDQREAFSRSRLREELPQGETQLVHCWFSRLAEGIPPNACTIWLTRTEPSPQYQLMIPGEAVAGEQPDRALFLYVCRNRRQAGVAETFHGRIRAPTRSGKVVELGGGVLHLPPDPSLAQSQAPGGPAGGAGGPWQMPPGQGWTPGAPYGPPAPPWGSPWGNYYSSGPAWGASYFGNMTPWGGPPPPGWGAQAQGAQFPPGLIEALKDKPDMVAMLQAMHQMVAQTNQPPAWQQSMMDMLMKRALAEPTKEKNTWAELASAADLLDKLRGPQKEGSGVSVTYVDDGSGTGGKLPLITKNGEIDTSMTLGIPAVGAMRGVMSAVKSKMTGTAPGMARGHAPTSANGANGTAKH